MGCGAIGTQIALAIDSGKIPATLTHVYDIERSQADNLVSKLKLKPEVGEWAVAKKIGDAGTNSSQDLAQKDLLMD